MKLKNLFSKRNNSNYSKNFCLKFDDLNSFIGYVSNNHDFDKNSLYYYMGGANSLVNLIGYEYSGGEKDIPHLSLECVGIQKPKSANIIFEDAIFIPDNVRDLVNKYNSLPNKVSAHCLFRSYTTGFHQVTKFVIARNSVYLCSK